MIKCLKFSSRRKRDAKFRGAKMSKDEKKPTSGKKDNSPDNKDKKPQWRAPVMVWVLLAVFIFSLIALFNGGGELF